MADGQILLASSLTPRWWSKKVGCGRVDVQWHCRRGGGFRDQEGRGAAAAIAGGGGGRGGSVRFGQEKRVERRVVVAVVAGSGNSNSTRRWGSGSGRSKSRSVSSSSSSRIVIMSAAARSFGGGDTSPPPRLDHHNHNHNDHHRHHPRFDSSYCVAQPPAGAVAPEENWRAKRFAGQSSARDTTSTSSSSPSSSPQQQTNGRIPMGGYLLSDFPLPGGEECEVRAASLVDSAVSLRPKRIILVRHGQSEGNIDESAYTRIPDSKISLTEDGWKQAIRCGKKIKEIIEGDEEDDWKVYFYVSPYRRTLQTLRGIGLAFDRHRIAGVREEPRIREQDFGNFQDREKMRVEKEIRLRYGRFFYRFPNGESAADVYDRITGFKETLRADIDVGRFQRPESRSKNMNLVMVSHGLTLRVFLMRWYKWTVQQFEGLWNFGNTGMMVMELGPGGRYSLTMHHTVADLKAFGMTEDMIHDQDWQKYAKPGELNHEWLTSGSSFFTHFDDFENGAKYDEIPADIRRNVLGRVHNGDLMPEPPVVE